MVILEIMGVVAAGSMVGHLLVVGGTAIVNKIFGKKPNAN